MNKKAQAVLTCLALALSLTHCQNKTQNLPADPTEAYIQQLADPELKEIFHLVIIKNMEDFKKTLTMVRLRHSGSQTVIVILGYWHVTVDEKPPYEPLQLLSEQNAYSIFLLNNQVMNFTTIGFEGMPSQAAFMLNTKTKALVLKAMTEVKPEVLEQQIASGNLFPLKLDGQRADLQATLAWQLAGKVKFIPMEDSQFSDNYKRYYRLSQQGLSLQEIDKQLGGAIIEQRDKYMFNLINNLPEENTFIPIGSVHALDLCLKFSQHQPEHNIIILFEPTAIPMTKSYNPAGWNQCLAADQAPH